MKNITLALALAAAAGLAAACGAAGSGDEAGTAPADPGSNVVTAPIAKAQAAAAGLETAAAEKRIVNIAIEGMT